MKKDKRYMITTALIVLLFVLMLLSQNTHLFFNKTTNDASQGTSVLIGKTTFFIDIADTGAKRRTGLSGRKILEEDGGLLFIFDKASSGGIWMVDMLFPIDIIWLDEDLHIVAIKENATPDSYPEVFYPEQEVWYVLEVNAGMVKKNNIVVGDQIKIL